MFALTQDAVTVKALSLLGFGLPGGPEWIIILVVALLVFGRRLPDVARSIGKSIVEFKKGLRDIEDEIDQASRSAETSSPPELPKETEPDSRRVSTADPVEEQPQSN